MRDGVLVDPLTEQFLEIARDPQRGLPMNQTLRHFFHDTRNHLSTVKSCLYLAKRGAPLEQAGIWSELDQNYRGLETLVDRLHTLCRPPTVSAVPASLECWLQERRSTWTEWLAARGRPLVWSVAKTPTRGCFDPKRLIEGLDALIGWRASEGEPGEPARLESSCDGSRFLIEWAEPEARITGPIEGREGRSISMALPLLALAMTAHGGSMTVASEPGLVIRLDWPVEPERDGPA